MLGNFTFHNPTKLHFGEDSLSKLSEELKNYGKKVMLCYGGSLVWVADLLLTTARP